MPLNELMDWLLCQCLLVDLCAVQVYTEYYICQRLHHTEMVMIEWHMVILKYDTCTGKDTHRERESGKQKCCTFLFSTLCTVFSPGFHAKNPFNAIDDKELTECDRTDFFQLQCNILRADELREKKSKKRKMK